MAGLKKVLEAMKGVVIVPNHQKSMSGIEEAMDATLICDYAKRKNL